MTLITRQDKGSKLTIAEMDGNLTYLESIGLSGTNYLFVAANGTDEENAAEIQAAYDLAKTMSPSADNRITVVAAPGTYKFPSTFVMDTEFIDLVSLTGNRDVVFDLEGITDPFEVVEQQIVLISECLLIDTDNTFVKGIKGKFYLSPNWDDWWWGGNGDYEDYILPIQVSNNLPNIKIENCEGGVFSLGGDITFSSHPIEVSGTFLNCVGDTVSFGGSGTASGTFINCIGGIESFGGFGTVTGIFTNCIGDAQSFGGFGTATGTFTNCIGDAQSFGGDGTLSGKLFYCRLTSGTFETVSGGGVTVLCIDGNNAVNTQN